MKLLSVITRNNHKSTAVVPTTATPKSIGEHALELFDNRHNNLRLTEPNDHQVAPLIPLIGQTTVCFLNFLLPFLPGERTITYRSVTAGDSLHEELLVTFSVVTLHANVAGVYVNWNLEFDYTKSPSSGDDDLVALALSGRVANAVAAIIESHVGMDAGHEHP